ncbi:hypothetical protein SpCBS45565_g01016 [Spizellomyces sp. 'palustris']|nr:hypothetical protein SpCBS45565_g01016 [Spizellomyces sp. 'palustris']
MADCTAEEGRRLLGSSHRGDYTDQARTCMQFALKLAQTRIAEPMKPNRIINSHQIADEDAIKHLRKLSRRACVYGCLAAFRLLQQRADKSIHRGELLRCRALFCQVLAIRLVRAIIRDNNGRDELFVEVLTPLFNSLQNLDSMESALQVAVETDAAEFINEISVQQCVEYLWRGIIIPQPQGVQDEDRANNDGYVQVYTWPSQVKMGWAALPEGRLRVPMYQYAAETLFNFFLLAVFSFVVNYRTPEPNGMEILMYLLVVSFAIAEVKQFWNQGSAFYFLTLFNCNDMISIVLFTLAFTFRMIGYYQGNKETLSGPNDTSYDLLACNAVFLWTRGINVLAGFRYFGEMVVIIRSMLRDAALFFVMFFFVLVGFVQAFAGLARAQPSESPGFLKGLYMLAKAFLQAPDFGDAEQMHDVLGAPLLVFFQILATVIMLNMLIAFFNQSYSNVVEAATQQHVVQFTLKVLGFYLLPTQYPFVPPTNLVEVTLLPLPRLILPRRAYLKYHQWIWIVAAFPINAVIAAAEHFLPDQTAANWNLEEDQEKEEEETEAEDRQFYHRSQVAKKSNEERSVEEPSIPDHSDSRAPDEGLEETLKFLVGEVKALREKIDELKFND